MVMIETEIKIISFYKACLECKTPGPSLRLVKDEEGKLASYSKPGMIFLICPKCERHTQPENWNYNN